MSASSLSSLIGGILVPLGILTVFALARKYLPAKPTTEASEYTMPIDEPDERFRTTQHFVGIAMVGVMVVIGWGGYVLLSSLNLRFADDEGAARFVLLPSSAIWWFFPGFAALTFAWDVVLFFWANMGDANQAYRYAEWSYRKAGFDAGRVLHWAAVIIVLPIGILTALALPMHTTLREDEMQIRGYASLKSVQYRYSDAKRVAVLKGYLLHDGNFEPRPAVIVDFADGRRWSSADNRDTSKFVDPDLVAFLHQKTGLPVIEADTIEKLP